MAQASATIDIPAPPDRVWQLIGGFGSLPDWLPYIPASELSEGGRVRRLTNPGGDTIVERLEAFDNALKINPNAAEAHVGKGQVALQQFETKDADSHAEQALNINPRLPSALPAGSRRNLFRLRCRRR